MTNVSKCGNMTILGIICLKSMEVVTWQQREVHLLQKVQQKEK